MICRIKEQSMYSSFFSCDKQLKKWVHPIIRSFVLACVMLFSNMLYKINRKSGGFKSSKWGQAGQFGLGRVKSGLVGNRMKGWGEVWHVGGYEVD